MNEILRLEDVRDQVLHGRPPTVDLSKRLNEFFQFSNWNRSLSDATPLQDCFFYDMFISPAGAAEADYRLFTECFPKIVGNLVAGHATLTLHVKSSSPDFFEELDVINTVLAPSSLRYVLLSESQGPTGGQHRPELGNLVFEWPAAKLDYVVERWFMCPQVSIEGYVAAEPALGRIAHLYFSPDTVWRIREILSAVELAFRLWPDDDGLFILTDKLDQASLQRRLRISELSSMVAQAVAKRRRRG